jgi:hypothetical protein
MYVTSHSQMNPPALFRIRRDLTFVNALVVLLDLGNFKERRRRFRDPASGNPVVSNERKVVHRQNVLRFHSEP